MVWCLLIYIGVALIWVRGKVWVPLSWSMFLILDDTGPEQHSSQRFKDFTRRVIEKRIVVPFSFFWPLHTAICILAWIYIGLMCITLRAWVPIHKRFSADLETPKAKVIV